MKPEASPETESEPHEIQIPPQVLFGLAKCDDFIHGIPLGWGDGLEEPAHEEL